MRPKDLCWILAGCLVFFVLLTAYLAFELRSAAVDARRGKEIQQRGSKLLANAEKTAAQTTQVAHEKAAQTTQAAQVKAAEMLKVAHEKAGASSPRLRVSICAPQA